MFTPHDDAAELLIGIFGELLAGYGAMKGDQSCDAIDCQVQGSDIAIT
jgi:hypothetical protein